MRSIARIGSSLAVVALLAGFVQEGQADLKALLKALSGGGPPAAEALAALDRMPASRLESIHRLLPSESREVRTACRAVLPPACWILSDLKTIGEIRERIRLYAADLRNAEPDQREVRLEAGRQLMLRGNEAAGVEAAKAYRECTPWESTTGTVVAVLGTPDLTPLLLETLEAADKQSGWVAMTLAAMGDGRAEAPLLLRGQKDEELRLEGLETLCLVGGPATLEFLRKEWGEATASWKWNKITQIRMRMRDPKLPADLLAYEGAEKHSLRLVSGGLIQLGDRSIVDELAKRAEDPKTPEPDRLAAFEALAALGDRRHVPLFVKGLDDPALTGAAADALTEFGDATAAAPLARALKFSQMGSVYARALLYVPLEGVEKDLLEILNDPVGHRMTFVFAVRVAGRHGGDKVRDKLLELLLDTGTRYYDGYEVARALAPLLARKDLRRLSRSSSPDAPRETEDVRCARLAVRGALGDEEARRDFVKACLAGNVRVRMDDSGNPLKMYSGKPEEILKYVIDGLDSTPTWNHGVEWLLRLRPEDGLARVKEAAKARQPSNLIRGLAALLAGEKPDPSMTHALGMLPDGILEVVARKLPDSAVDKLRRSLLAESLDGTRELTVIEGGRPVKRKVKVQNLVGDVRLAMLAARRDPILESVYRAWLRAPQQFGEALTERMTALALADLRADYMFDTYARWLRGEKQDRRTLGARCLARLGDARAISRLAPLLEDFEKSFIGEVDGAARLMTLHPRARRICDEAADAIETLSGRKFPGERAERIEAIKKWVAENPEKR